MIGDLRCRLNMCSSPRGPSLLSSAELVELHQGGSTSLRNLYWLFLSHVWHISVANGGVLGFTTCINRQRREVLHSQNRDVLLRYLAPSLVVVRDCLSISFSRTGRHLRPCISSSVYWDVFVGLWIRRPNRGLGLGNFLDGPRSQEERHCQIARDLKANVGQRMITAGNTVDKWCRKAGMILVLDQ
jgi:hypothetical protein